MVHWVGSPKNNLSPKFLLLSDFLQFIDFTLHNILNCNIFSRLKRHILTCLVRRCFILQVCSLEFSFLEETPYLNVGSKYFRWVTFAPSVSDLGDVCRKFHLRGCEVSRGCTALRSPPAPLDSDPSDRKLPPSSHKGAALLADHRGAHPGHHNPHHNYHCTLHLYGGVVLLPGHHDSYSQVKSSLDMTTPYPQAMSTTTATCTFSSIISYKGASQATSHCHCSRLLICPW